MFFQHEVIGSSSWLMLLFRIGEPFQNSRDIRKKLIMSAADSHKHKHVKHNKRTLWVTCFFLVAFLNCLPFPKSRSIRTSGTSSRERACPRACWILAFLQSQLWARRCLEKSRLFLLTQMITWDTYGYVVVFFNPKICKDLPLQLQDDVRVHVCGCLQLQLVVTEAGGRNLYTRYLQYNNIVAYCSNYNLPTDLWFMIIQPNRIAQSSKAAELWR